MKAKAPEKRYLVLFKGSDPLKIILPAHGGKATTKVRALHAGRVP